MDKLTFEEIKEGMDVYIRYGSPPGKCLFYLSTVIFTTKGHLMSKEVRLVNGEMINYNNRDISFYAVNPDNKLELMLEAEEVRQDKNHNITEGPQ